MLKQIQSIYIIGLLLLTASTASSAADSLYKAFQDGSFDFNARYRYEAVDDEFGTARNARASTLRTTLGYETGMFHAFNAYLQFEDIREIGADEFNSPADPDPRYDTVADPIQTSVLQGYIGYAGLPDTKMKLGRQIITYRDAPFHRFIGTVGWRQHWQTFDALSVQNSSLPDTQLSYAYLWQVNRIFGDDAPSPLDEFDSDSHLFNAQYTGLPNTKLQAYSYLLNFDNGDAFSTQTYGVRAEGHYPFNDRVKGLYAAEYAHQSDYADNPADIDADYFFGELGLGWAPNGPIDNVTVKLSYEFQEGSGGNDRFVTILGTNHAFQGWADRFLVTPGDGEPLRQYFSQCLWRKIPSTTTSVLTTSVMTTAAKSICSPPSPL